MFVTTVAHNDVILRSDALASVAGRRKRMSDPASEQLDTGAIYLTTSDGRYIKRIVVGQLQIPTAIVTLSQLGRICYADSGLAAKIECADMDGNMRKVTFLF